jgi:DeoR/GlpR family transcriptional regulator of sugar metabolism
MLAQKRQNVILEMLRQSGGIIKINDIVSKFNVSNETARRDLETLQDNNLVKRIYGGAILSSVNSFIPVREDGSRGQAERVAIGQAAAELVHDGETVILSTGTTVLQVSRYLKRLHSLTVITNSLAVVNELSNTNFEIFVLGGKLDTNEKNMYGDMALMSLRSVFADKAFIGAGGITFEFGVSDYGVDDFTIREGIIKHSIKTILVAQSEKFGSNAFSLGLSLNQMGIVVSDTNLSQEYQQGIKDMGIELILAKP